MKNHSSAVSDLAAFAGDCDLEMTRTDPIGAILEGRNRLKTRLGCQFISIDQYCEMAISNRQYDRDDEPLLRMRGLVDPASGQRYLIEEEKIAAMLASEVIDRLG